MIASHQHIAKARNNLAGGHLLLANAFVEQAAREAYLAAFVTLLGTAYEWKTYADYDGGTRVSDEEAADALVKAAEMVDLIEGILP